MTDLISYLYTSLLEIFSTEWMGLMLWQYMGLLLYIILAFVVRKIFEYLLANYIRRLTKPEDSVWDSKQLHKIDRPAGYLIVIAFLWAFFPESVMPQFVVTYARQIFEVLISVAAIWLLYNLTESLSNYLAKITSKTESKLDDQLVPLLRKTLKVFIVVFGLLVLLQNNGINVASILAGLGIGGLAIALAARDTLSNFFGSLTIFLDRPFQVGDWVKTQNTEGIVEEVGFRSTRVRTFYNSVISVPNSMLANSEIDNLGLRQQRRIYATLGLTYSTTPKQMEAFVEGIKALIKSNSKMKQDFFEVHFTEYAAYSLNVMVYCFIDTREWSDELEVKHRFFLQILQLAKDVGVEFAFPTQTLHVDSFFSDQPRQVGRKLSDEELGAAVTQYGPNGAKSNPQLDLYYQDKPINNKSAG